MTNTTLVLIDNNMPEQEKIKRVVDILRDGGIAGIPTETVFGLACNGSDERVLDRLFKVKKRQTDKHFVIQVAGLKQLAVYKPCITPEAGSIIKEFWPGPLTVILETKNGKKGFRIPDNKVMLAVLEQADFPVAVTSANISGEKELTCAQDVKSFFDGKIQIVVDDNTRAQGIASTVLDCTQQPFKVLREGPMLEEIYRFLRLQEEPE